MKQIFNNLIYSMKSMLEMYVDFIKSDFVLDIVRFILAIIAFIFAAVVSIVLAIILTQIIYNLLT